MKRGETKPGQKRSEKRLAGKFPAKRKNRIPLIMAGYQQKKMTKQQWDEFRRRHSRS